MRVVLALDAGAMLARAEVPIDPDDTTGSLEARLAIVGASLLRRCGRSHGTRRGDRRGAAGRCAGDTGAEDREAGRPHRLDAPARERSTATSAACSRGRGAFTFVDGQRLVLREAQADPRPAGDAPPGTLVAQDGDALLLACGDGTTLRVVRVQPDGKRVMTTREWRLGRRIDAPLRAGVTP